MKIDLSEFLEHLDFVQEDFQIEAKKALGGLPHSLWETYSAFANTDGGVILLGVEEYKDHSLHLVSLSNAHAMVDEFWSIINDSKKISKNILDPEDVQIIDIQGHTIIYIVVPKAYLQDMPVYIGIDPYSGSYYRLGEADIRLPRSEVDKLLAKKKRP